MSTHHDDELVPLQKRRATDTKKGLWNLEILGRVPFPDELATLPVQTEKFSFCTIAVAPVLGQ